MTKNEFNQDLLVNSKRSQTTFDKVPIIARYAVSERARKTLDLV